MATPNMKVSKASKHNLISGLIGETGSEIKITDGLTVERDENYQENDSKMKKTPGSRLSNSVARQLKVNQGETGTGYVGK